MWYFEDQYTQICKDQVIEKITQISQTGIEMTGYFSDCTPLDRFQVIFEENEKKVKISSNCLSPLFNRTLIVMGSKDNENVFGFGEHSGDVNMKGKILSNFAREPGMFRDFGFLNFVADLFVNRTGGKPYYSYYPAPLFLTTELRGLYLINDNYNIFDMTESKEIKLMVWSPKISLFLFDDETFPGLISKLTELTGRMKPLPNWIMSGAVVAITGGSDKLRSAYHQLRKFNSSLAGIWTQDWSGKRFDGNAMRLWWNWEVDRDYYPDWDNFTEELKRDGVRRMTYINPMLHNISGYLNKSTNFFEIAAERNYLIRDFNNDIIFYELSGFRAGMIDFTNPEAYNFYKQIVKEYMFNDSQTYGFMADFGEDPPIDNILYNNSFAETDAIHNIYPYYLPKLCSEAAQEYFGSSDEIVFFTRSGNKLSPNYTRLVWAGDQLENWDGGNGLKSGLKGMLNIGLSGAQLTHTDVGGYIDFSFHGFFNIDRTQELLLRWIELGAFSVVFRTHEGTGPDKTPQVYSNDEIAGFFANFTKVYLSWKQYRTILMQEAYETGMPVLRHMVIHYLHDPVSASLNEQYMLGEDLIVAPVLEQGSETKMVYFPVEKKEKVEWVHLWSREKFDSCGCWREIEAPIGKPAVFFKGGSRWGEEIARYLKEIQE